MRPLIRILIAGMVFISILLFTGWQLASLAVDAGLMVSLLDKHAQAGLDSRHDEMAVMTTDYLSGKTDVFQLEISGDGGNVPAFQDREIAHMADVKHLVGLGLSMRWILLGCLALAGLLYFFNRKGKGMIRTRDVELGASYGVFLFYALLLSVVLWGILDFTSLFTVFHHVLFTNDLWLLNPQTDKLIQLMPEPFFMEYATRLVTRNFMFYLGILLAAFYFVFGKTKETT